VPYGPYRSQAEQQQHVLMFRKVLLRRRLMRWISWDPQGYGREPPCCAFGDPP